MLALKVLRPEIAADPAMAERFKNELRLARRITHKNVCRIHDFNRLGDCAFITMEYVDGESLRALLERTGPLPPTRVVGIARQVCAGLREAHAQGIVHRDLKPENIMLTRQGLVKLLDFGIARSLDAAGTTTQTLIGTPAYMAPEQARGVRADARIDIYALGLVLYECLAGRRAFSGATPIEVALKQVQEAPAPLSRLRPDLPVALGRAVLRCLEKEPERRYASVDALSAALSDAPATTAAVRGSGWLKWVAALAVTIVVAGAWKSRYASRAPATSPIAAVPLDRGSVPIAAARRSEPEQPAVSDDRVPRTSAEAPSDLIAAAQAGDAKAQFRLAQLYSKGLAGARDEHKAFAWLKRAAENGDAEAQFALGRLYESGPPRLRDAQNARQWYERAAGQGYEPARARLRAERAAR